MKVHKTYETRIQAPVEDLWQFHSSAEALTKLSMPGQTVMPVGEDLEVRDGALHVLRIRSGPVSFEWRARISEVQTPAPGEHCGFTDLAEKSPFVYWRHRHQFNRDGDSCILRDEIVYSPPGGPLGILTNLVVSRMVDKMFEHRHRVTRGELEVAARNRRSDQV